MSFPVRILISIVFASAFFWLAVYCITPVTNDTFVSLLATTVSGLLTLAVLCVYYRHIRFFTAQSTRWTISIFALRIIFGVIHYLLVLDSSYFTDLPAFDYLWDYVWLHNSMIYVTDYWDKNGFGGLPLEFMLGNKNAILTGYMALLYYLGNSAHYLNIVVLNSIHAVFVAVMVSAITRWLVGPREALSVLIICLVQPFGFASSIFWRDSVGQFFVIGGIAMVVTVGRGGTGLFVVAIASFLMSFHRVLYFIFGPGIYLVRLLTSRTYSATFQSRFAVISGFSFLLLYAGQLYDATLGAYADAASGPSFAGLDWTLVAVVERSIRSLIGPFPWYQIFDPEVTGRAYLLFDMLQSSYCLVILILTIEYIWKSRPELTDHQVLIIFSVFLFASSGFVSWGHTSYVTVATALLLSVIHGIRASRFIRLWTYLIMVYVLGSIIWYFIR